jgi:RNA polymerase sigma-70 factor (ECF subfamily)
MSAVSTTNPPAQTSAGSNASPFLRPTISEVHSFAQNWARRNRDLARSMEPEDIVQEVELRLWKKFGGDDNRYAIPTGETSWEPLVATIATHIVCDCARHDDAPRHGGTYVHVPIGDHDPAEASSMLDSLERRDQLERIRRCADTLPDLYRKVIIQMCFDGRDYESIARDEGIPVTTLRTHVMRGLQMLREILKTSRL